MVIGLDEVDERQVALVGGKGAGLGALARIDGIEVPPGFCVTTDAFRQARARIPEIGRRLDELARLGADDRDAIRVHGAALRTALERVAIPDAVAAAIVAALARLGEDAAYAVRSSATAEDTPTASFAGQHDSYLDVVGRDAVLEHVRRAWGSLFTERAIAYRLRNGIDHRAVDMAVVVQRMVDARAAGVLFTADPVTGNRRVAAVEAVAGLGEALVSGAADPDRFAVRDDAVVARAARQDRPVLTDAQALALTRLGRTIEARLGRPQDIEWCLADDGFAFVQSRPITTLFPIPTAPDASPRVYVSVGHGQMMTDAMAPLGLSVFQLTAKPVMHEAGSRLFVEVTDRLASPATAAATVAALGRSDPLIGDALRTVVDRGFVPTIADDDSDDGPAHRSPGPPPALPEPDPALIAELVAGAEASLADLARAVAPLSGPAVLDLIRDDIVELRRVTFDPRGIPLILAGMEAAWWLSEHLGSWLGDRGAADTLAQSVPGDVTAEMGLALLDVADAIRPHPEVVAFLRETEDENFLAALPTLPGGPEARAAIEAFLDRYGMRCVGEIDLTRPRWSERPRALVPLILGNIGNFAPGEGARRFERGRQEAADKEREVLERLRALPDGARKADEAKRMIDRVRTLSGYREYPKYHIICRYFIYKNALLAEARRLVAAGVLHEADEAFFLTFQELREAARTHAVDHALTARRRRALTADATLTPPRVLTSEGEAIAGSYRRDDLPDGALVGLPVSAGTVEGRARVIRDMADAEVRPGDILVTAHTDPSWSPLFVAVAGLVTEVGGRMTHGAVIAREYGLPAVVGLDRATELIRDGQRIRVHGTDGYVELLS
ncbi:MAG TPA: phosphoenolpyruvate synthase [Baekduia sp.]|uniref:phosphoenolpyruvate synthase n=1 Tax=Baekduia sp. TaxID=2600305 RepID=UPI002D767E28|nr:phosphoenolpyruvate synthase [Baekduia sp.]HET6510302.1 phosphoenolpyruvate synthase [Baekduia sp.]